MNGRSIEFEKMHGLGNDFILVRREQLVEGEDWNSHFVTWCRPKTGIGADGVLILAQETPTSCHLEVINRDGTQAEVCGNGLRCAARSWAARQTTAATSVVIHTMAGPRDCILHPDGQVTVDMGPVQPLPPLADAMDDTERITSLPINTPQGEHTGIGLSMGNPHLVWFDPPLQRVNQREAARLEKHPRFPHRANVSFARISGPAAISLTVWERGCGFTMACGSAACATAAAAVATRRLAPETPIEVALPGGSLVIRVSRDLSKVLMTGPAVWVFAGRIDL